jgi:hypothetical protein
LPQLPQNAAPDSFSWPQFRQTITMRRSALEPLGHVDPSRRSV